MKLPEYTLLRRTDGDEGTFGILLNPKQHEVCLTAELPWYDNIRGKSCIPTGKYKVTYLKETYSGKFKDVYWIRDVSDRSGILIHIGNFVGNVDKGLRSDSYGCILPCMEFGILGEQRAGLYSHKAMNKLYEEIGYDSFYLTILWCLGDADY